MFWGDGNVDGVAEMGEAAAPDARRVNVAVNEASLLKKVKRS
jgi:hypothetical protein